MTKAKRDDYCLYVVNCCEEFLEIVAENVDTELYLSTFKKYVHDKNKYSEFIKQWFDGEDNDSALTDPAFKTYIKVVALLDQIEDETGKVKKYFFGKERSLICVCTEHYDLVFATDENSCEGITTLFLDEME